MSEEVRDESNDGIICGNEEVIHPQRDHSSNNKKSSSTLKEENDKLRTYLGLVKMCNNSAVNKIKSAINETMNLVETKDNTTDMDVTAVLKQLAIIQNEISNMQTMHSQLEEGIEAFQVVDNNSVVSSEQTRDSIVMMSASIETPRKSTGIRKSSQNRSFNKSKSKSTKDSTINSKLLTRISDKRVSKGFDNSQTTDGYTEEEAAVANIAAITPAEERENVSQSVSDSNVAVVRTKAPKRPYISEEFKSSHLQRLVEAKRRREEMNKQLEREGKRKPKPKRADDLMREVTDFGKKSPKKRQIKKKTIGKVIKKKVQSLPMAGTQSIVVPISQSTLDSLSGQTIQIIASGGTQILCRNEGTFIPATNSTQWQTSTSQWTAATAGDNNSNNFSQNQWNQYQS